MDYKKLVELYSKHKKSVSQIADHFDCSQGKVNYWLSKFSIKKRTISEAIYQVRNPLGDPFMFRRPNSRKEWFLYGTGLGLYWGEGLKRGRGGVRLGNTDVYLIQIFIKFLERFFSIRKSGLRFGLQIFNDISPDRALAFWMKNLRVQKKQFYKVMVSKVRGSGTYTYKSEYGVLMIYFNNVKLKQIICNMIDNIHKI